MELEQLVLDPLRYIVVLDLSPERERVQLDLNLFIPLQNHLGHVCGVGGGDPLFAIGNMMEIKCGQNFFHGKWVVAKHGFSIEGWKMKVFMENVLSKCALRARALWSFFHFPKITCTAVQPLFLEFWKII